jgi:hypothetical protein
LFGNFKNLNITKKPYTSTCGGSRALWEVRKGLSKYQNQLIIMAFRVARHSFCFGGARVHGGGLVELQ